MKELNKDYGFHSLRHTYASLLISKNVPIKFVQEQLGHSDIRMTMNIYGHLMPTVREQSRQLFNDVSINL